MKLFEHVADELIREIRLRSASFCHLHALAGFDATRNAMVARAASNGTRMEEVRLSGPDPLKELLAIHPVDMDEHLLIVLTGFEDLVGRTPLTINTRLAPLRPPAHVVMKAGARIVFLSKVPLLRVRDPLTSILAMDCVELNLPRAPLELIRAMCEEVGIGPEAENVLKFSLGWPAAVDAFVAIGAQGISSSQKLLASRQSASGLFREVITCLGPELASWMEHWIFECNLYELSRSDIPDEIYGPLRRAGVVEPAFDHGAHLFPGPMRALWKDALGSYLDSSLEPSRDWAGLATTLFRLERLIRLATLRRLVEVYGDRWKGSIPGRTPPITCIR